MKLVGDIARDSAGDIAGDIAEEVGAGHVLVGFAPGTTGTVLDTAAQIAARLGRDIVLLHVSRDPSLSVPDTAAVAKLAAEHLRAALGTGQDVSVQETTGPAADALVRASREACLLVLGSDRDAGLAEVVHHDVITTVAVRAVCPVLVVHARSGVADPELVVTIEESGASGVDGVPDGAHRVGAGIARALGQSLRVLPHLDGRGSAQAMMDASDTSSVLVLRRGTDGGLSHHLSDEGRRVLRDARCPVLVVDAYSPTTDVASTDVASTDVSISDVPTTEEPR